MTPEQRLTAIALLADDGGGSSYIEYGAVVFGEEEAEYRSRNKSDVIWYLDNAKTPLLTFVKRVVVTSGWEYI
jgi:hypothetical protein